MPSTTPSLASILAALRGCEPPECGCRVEVVPVCTVVGGCERRCKGRACSCPRWPGQPCRHLRAWMERRPDQLRLVAALMILARAFPGDPPDAWAAALWRLFPADYCDRPAPSCGARAVTRGERVALRRLRAHLRLGLWHEDDQLQQQGRAAVHEEEEGRAAADERRHQKTLEAKRVQRQQEAFLAMLHGGKAVQT